MNHLRSSPHLPNAVGHSRLSDLPGDVFAALDRLPPRVRRLFWDGVTQWDPREAGLALDLLASQHVTCDAAHDVIAHLMQDADRSEVTNFAADPRNWPPRFGPYPALAAQASILRWTPTHPGKNRAQKRIAP